MGVLSGLLSAERSLQLLAGFDRLSREKQGLVRFAVVSAISACIGIASVFYWSRFFDTISWAKSSPMNVALLLVMPMLTVAALGALFLRWQLLLRVAGQRVPIRPSLSVFLAGLVGIATIAHVGELLSCVLLRRRFGTQLRISVPVLLITRLCDVAALSMILIVSAGSGRLALVGLTFLLAAAIGAGVLWTLAPMLGFARERRDAFLRFDALVPALVLSLAAWVLVGSVLAVAALALGAAMPLVTSTRVFALATLVGGASLVPAGIGITGSLAIFDLQSAGVELSTAITAVTLTRLATTWTALLLGLIFVWRECRGRVSQALTAPAHFDEIAAEYSDQWSPHMWDLLIERKLDMMGEALPPPGAAGAGLDLGCGIGLQTAAMRARGFDVVGIDPSEELLRVGRSRTNSAPLHTGSALDIPFPDAHFNFVYMIGVMHHLPGREAQDRAMREIHRVLQPGGIFLIHESNTRNPLFKFYMSYVFPLLKTIDDGTEYFIDPRRWADFPGFSLRETRYFTFLPDFMPQALMKAGSRLERQLENGRARRYSAHYFAVMRREEADRSAAARLARDA